MPNLHSPPLGISIRDLVRPILALAFASMVSCFVLALRVAVVGELHQLYLVWNLFLAWMPLAFGLTAVCFADTRPQRPCSFFAAATAWLLFLPNAPYIVTDLVHLGSKSHSRYWTDLVLILIFAFIGLVLGFLSLFLMQRLVARRHGWLAGWFFVGIAAVLSGFGIYAGRFLRWNSWDVVFNPIKLFDDAGHWLCGLISQPLGLKTPALFGTTLFLAYLLLYSLTHLPGTLRAPANDANARHT